jgi:hypothetical protein
MDIRSALKRQYHAALKTLRIAIEKCPDEMWNDPADGKARFWRVAYHALFFTHFYGQQSPQVHRPWARYREHAEHLSTDNLHDLVPKSELLEYWDFTDTQVDANVDKLDLDAKQCGFPWYKMPTLDHQIVNIRHIQHHAACLAKRLRRGKGIEVDWVGG